MIFPNFLEKYGKDFNDIRQDFLPWKSPSNLIEYYYLWKTTDRYVQQKRVKAVEAESKLKQVYIPTYTKPHPAAIGPAGPASKNGAGLAEIGLGPGKACDCCAGLLHFFNNLQISNFEIFFLVVKVPVQCNGTHGPRPRLPVQLNRFRPNPVVCVSLAGNTGRSTATWKCPAKAVSSHCPLAMPVKQRPRSSSRLHPPESTHLPRALTVAPSRDAER